MEAAAFAGAWEDLLPDYAAFYKVDQTAQMREHRLWLA